MLPNPEQYSSWQEYAKALNKALGDSGVTDFVVPAAVGGGGLPGEGPATSITMPDGFQMVWLDATAAELYLGNPAFDPPEAGDLFRIDTINIADAAIETSKLLDSLITTPKIADFAVVNAKILDATILGAKIANATIVSALIGDAQIVTAKIDNLAVNEAKIANLAVTSAKIANLAVGAAQIQNAAVGNAQIGNIIQSAGWDGINGWQIDKTGTIQGTSIIIRNTDGSVAFAAGHLVNLSTQVTGLLALTNTSGNLDASRTTGFGAMSLLNLLTTGNISTYIQSAAIVQALIANAAIGSAQIIDASILSAKIADLAVGSAKIADLAVTNAKIDSLTFSKLTAGTLDAVIDMGTGLIKFTIGGSQLILGKGFGTTSQFFLWFGPTQASPANCTETNGLVWLKTSGDAYFGGSLALGVLRNGNSASGTGTSVSADTGTFGSNGGTIEVAVAWSYLHKETTYFPATIAGQNDFDALAALYDAVNVGGQNWAGSKNFTVAGSSLTLERAYGAGALATVQSANTTDLTGDFTGIRPVNGADPGEATVIRSAGISFTYTDPDLSLLTRQYVATLARGFSHTGGVVTQRVTVTSVEE